MMITCPECGGKIPDTEQSCPICGCAMEIYRVRPSVQMEEIPDFEEVRIPKKSFIGLFFRRIFELILFLLICSVILLVVLMTDFMGARTSLRQMCMADSGSGSSADHQVLRVEVKHYILQGLDLIDNGGAPGKIEIRKIVPEEKKVYPSASRKKEREPLELPPEPPKIQSFDETVNTEK